MLQGTLVVYFSGHLTTKLLRSTLKSILFYSFFSPFAQIAELKGRDF